MNKEGPQGNASAMRCGKAVHSVTSARASQRSGRRVVDVAGGERRGWWEEEQGGSGGGGGGTGTEAGIAMGGGRVVVVEYQSIDIIEQRRPAARPL